MSAWLLIYRFNYPPRPVTASLQFAVTWPIQSANQGVSRSGMKT